MVQVLSFPDQDLLDAVSPLPDGLRGVIWDMKNSPQGAEFSEIQGVVLPYLGASTVLPALANVPNLEYVQAQSTGYDGIVEAAGPKAGVATASGVHASATAELAVGLILAKLRGIDQAARDQINHEWRHARRRSLADRRILLLGFGGIGQEIARRLEPFEVTVTRVGSRARQDEFGQVHGTDELLALAPDHDVLVAILPLNEATHHLVGATVLAALPDGALVVNVGRGAVVDTEALTREVVAGRLECALDVMDPEPLPDDHPLWDSPHALITPHIGGNTSAFYPRMVSLLRSQIRLLADGEAPRNLVQQGPF